jgi:hypothetical protein
LECIHSPLFMCFSLSLSSSRFLSLSLLPFSLFVQLVACAKDIATRATELAKLLRRIASKIDPPENKQLLNCASLLRDRAIQVKMLAAVSAASGSVGGMLTLWWCM